MTMAMKHAMRWMLLWLGLALAACGGGGASTDSGTGSPNDPGTTPPTGGGVEQPAPDDSDPGTPDDDGQTPPDEDEQPDDPDNDTQAPKVTATTPDDHDNDVATNVAIGITFDEAIDLSFLNNVTLMDADGPIAVDVSLNSAQLTLTPRNALTAGTVYTVSVNGARDLAGNIMSDEYRWQFTTASGLCAGFYSNSFNLVAGKDTTPASSGLAKPVKGVPYTDPAYGTCVVRVADHEKEGLAQQSRNLYSRIQPFNANDSYLLVNSLDGYFHLYDVQTTAYIRKLSLGGGSVEPQWHPSDPSTLFVLPNHGGMTISKVNVDTGVKQVVADFRSVNSIHGRPGKTSLLQIWPTAARVWTHWEGSPSRDARYWGFLVETSGGAPLGMITYDLVENVITGVFDYATDGGGIDAPDHISMSPSGDYVVPSWNGSGENCPSRSELGTRNAPCGLMSYTRDFSSAKGLTVRGPHSDIGIDANGRDVIVAGDYDSGWVEMWDLGTGQATRLWQIYENSNSTAMHISARNLDKPGWVLISTYMEKKPGWYVNKVFAVEMKANPRILNIAHSYNTVETYYSETHAAVNRDFTRVVFNSNWNTANYLNTDVYMITLPPQAIPQL